MFCFLALLRAQLNSLRAARVRGRVNVGSRAHNKMEGCWRELQIAEESRRRTACSRRTPTSTGDWTPSPASLRKHPRRATCIFQSGRSRSSNVLPFDVPSNSRVHDSQVSAFIRPPDRRSSRGPEVSVVHHNRSLQCSVIDLCQQWRCCKYCGSCSCRVPARRLRLGPPSGQGARATVGSCRRQRVCFDIRHLQIASPTGRFDLLVFVFGRR